MRPVLTTVLVLMFALPAAAKFGWLADRIAPGSVPVLVSDDSAVFTPAKRGANVLTTCYRPHHETCSRLGTGAQSGLSATGAIVPDGRASPVKARRKSGKKGKRSRTSRVMIA